MKNDVLDSINQILVKTRGHTPGPWTAGGVPSWKYEHCCLEDQRNIYPPLGEAGPVAEVSGPENQALITAAPDMRALLERIGSLLAQLHPLAVTASSTSGEGKKVRAARDELVRVCLELGAAQ